jgi:hypothetical protein
MMLGLDGPELTYVVVYGGILTFVGTLLLLDWLGSRHRHARRSR